MSQAVLTSKDNPIARKIRQVAAQARGAPPDLVLAEGLRVLEEATRSAHPFEVILTSERFGRQPREAALLDAWRSRRFRIGRASASLLRNLSDAAAAGGALALVQVPRLTLDNVSLGGRPLILCACGIQDPGNLGTLIRSSAASGAAAVCTLAGSVSVRNPKTVRASAGAVFRLPLVERIAAADFLQFCRRRRIQCYRADPHAGITYSKLDLTLPAALLMGHETRGVDDQLCAVPAVRIPMQAPAESLNVASAGAILLFEALRQRSSASIGANQ